MTESLPNYPQAVINKEPFWSWIWVLPLVAFITGAWLVTVYYLEKGPTVVIAFDSAEGIEEGRTHIRYRDVDVGKVIDISLQEFLIPVEDQPPAEIADEKRPKTQTRVLVKARLEPFMADYLGEDTSFWVVRPRISASEVSGISTLFSGFYIGMDPGSRQGSLPNTFMGLETPPQVTALTKGLELVLNTRQLGSVNIGAPVYYRQLKAGEVVAYELAGNDSVNVTINIADKFIDKISSNTRFWNASGFTVEMNPSGGVSAHMESLISVLIGGIAFDTPEDEQGYPLSGETSFTLHENFKTAWEDKRTDKLVYRVYFEDTLFGLALKAPVMHQGVEVGKVEAIRLQTSNNSQRARTEVTISIHSGRFTDNADSPSESIIQELVNNGLRAQLKTASLLTGSKIVSLVYDEHAEKEGYQLAKTRSDAISTFPAVRASGSIIDFDPTALSNELTYLVHDMRMLVSSNDTKRLLKQAANVLQNLQGITNDLEKSGLSKQMVNTIETLENTLLEIQQVAKRADQTLLTADKTIKQTLGDDAGLQYRLEVLMEDLGQAADSFSVLADTIQRKPNAVIFGK
jgi:paraquat-inducible protein B